MKKVNIDTAIKRYNSIMYQICWTNSVVGDSNSDWNLRDMVSEMQYVYDLWNDPMCTHWEDAHDDCQPICNGRKEWLYRWQLDTARMKRFIDTYSPFVGDMVCAEGHCSKFD